MAPAIVAFTVAAASKLVIFPSVTTRPWLPTVELPRFTTTFPKPVTFAEP